MTKEEYSERVIYFTGAVYHWQEYFGLNEWEIFIRGGAHDDHKASCSTMYDDMMCTIKYNEKWLGTKKVTLEEISKVAFHEVLECFLSKMSSMLQYTWCVSDTRREVHKVIKVFENKLFPLVYGKEL